MVSRILPHLWVLLPSMHGAAGADSVRVLWIPTCMLWNIFKSLLQRFAKAAAEGVGADGCQQRGMWTPKKMSMSMNMWA